MCNGTRAQCTTKTDIDIEATIWGDLFHTIVTEEGNTSQVSTKFKKAVGNWIGCVSRKLVLMKDVIKRFHKFFDDKRGK
jgi:hypothetical protein